MCLGERILHWKQQHMVKGGINKATETVLSLKEWTAFPWQKHQRTVWYGSLNAYLQLQSGPLSITQDDDVLTVTCREEQGAVVLTAWHGMMVSVHASLRTQFMHEDERVWVTMGNHSGFSPQWLLVPFKSQHCHVYKICLILTALFTLCDFIFHFIPQFQF